MGGAACGLGAVEAGQYVGGAFVQCPEQREQLAQCLRPPLLMAVMAMPDHGLAACGVALAVCGDNLGMDAPGGFHCDRGPHWRTVPPGGCAEGWLVGRYR